MDMDTLGLWLVRCRSSPPCRCCKDVDAAGRLTMVSEDGELCGCKGGKL